MEPMARRLQSKYKSCGCCWFDISPLQRNDAQFAHMINLPSPLPPDPWTYYSRFRDIKIRYSDYGDSIPRQTFGNLCQQAEAVEETHVDDMDDPVPRTPLIYSTPIAKLVVMPSGLMKWSYIAPRGSICVPVSGGRASVRGA